MSDRFTDNVTLLNAATLNQFEADMKEYVDEQKEEVPVATQNKVGGIKIWLSGTTLYIKTN